MSEKKKRRSRKKKPFPVKPVITGFLAVAALTGMGAGYYIQKMRQYETVFFPSTMINGIDASNKTVEQVEDLISSGVDEYVLTLVKRGGETEQITGEEIGLHSVFDGSLEQYLAGQEPVDWWKQQTSMKEYQIETMIVFDEEKLEEVIGALELFDQDKIQEPKDAYLSEYEPGSGYYVVPEEPGNMPDREKTVEGIKEAVRNLKTDLVLEDLDIYKKAAVTSDDPWLNELAGRLNQYANMTVTYLFGEKEEILDGSMISQWLILGEDGQVSIDREAVTAYVKSLAEKYNTAYKKKVLKTSYGQSVEIAKGFYGWRIDQGEEAEQLYQVLLSGESQSREPVYLQRGASHGENDYGDTYVEINLTAQHLYFYKDGELVVESDFVSGNSARGYDTPSGAYPLTYKQRNAVLRGDNYATPVSYWMPFNGNIGMHDATWRGSFGGNIYKTNGSHGCINLPPAVARTIFENIEKGMPVLCYHLEGTESTKRSSGGSGGTKRTQTSETVPAAESAAAIPQESTEAVAMPGEGAEGQIAGSETGQQGEAQITGAEQEAGISADPGTVPPDSGETETQTALWGPGETGNWTVPSGPGEAGSGTAPAGPGGSGTAPSGPGETGSQTASPGPGETGALVIPQEPQNAGNQTGAESSVPGGSGGEAAPIWP